MKNTLFLLTLAFFGFSEIKAQCSGCSTTVSNLSAANYVVSAGQKLCVTSTGTITGLIAVNGGTLCNQGHIQTGQVLIAGGGFFQNDGYADIDSLLVTGTQGGQQSRFSNSALATMINERLATTDHALSENYGSVTADYLGDSLSTFENHGNVLVNIDFYNTYSSSFNNHNMMKIRHDFYNSTSSTFATACIIDVEGSWYNSWNITNALALQSCGGFRINGTSFNSGLIFPMLDICDTGNPPSHFDMNTVVLSPTVTYCVCNNYCNAILSISEQQEIDQAQAYPNPASDQLSIMTTVQADQLDLYNTYGQLMTTHDKQEMTQDANIIRFSLKELPAGMYFIVGRVKGQAVLGSRFIKE